MVGVGTYVVITRALKQISSGKSKEIYWFDRKKKRSTVKTILVPVVSEMTTMPEVKKIFYVYGGNTLDLPIPGNQNSKI